MNQRPLRIVALADSLALPRFDGDEHVTWDDTWPYRLQQILNAREYAADVINCGKRARLIETVNAHDFREHIVWKVPDVLILQVGVVDCAPRIFSRKQNDLLNLPVVPAAIRNPIIKWASANRRKIIGNRPLARVYTPPEQFEAHLIRFGKRVTDQDPALRLLVMPIVIDWDRAENKSPGYGANVRAYNQILQRFCEAQRATWVELPQLTTTTVPNSSYFCSDGYHLNPEGHRLLATTVRTTLVELGMVRDHSLASLA